MNASPLDAVAPGAFPLPVEPFPPTSRYHGVPLARGTWEGREVRYLTRRFLPRPDAFALVREHLVTEGERADHLAFAAFGDAELSWRLGDANGVLHLAELEEVGRQLRVTLPEGVPGAPEGT